MRTSKAWANLQVKQIASKSQWQRCSAIVGSTLGRAVDQGVKLGLALSIASALLVQGTAAFAQGVQCKCYGNVPSLPGADDVGQFGSELNAAEFEAAVQALPPTAFRTPRGDHRLPSRAVLKNLPAVLEQGTAADLGSPGSCEAHSFGYGLGSYTAAHEPDGSLKWNPAKPQNSISPAYLYEWALTTENRTCGDGTLATPYLEHLVELGAPTRARVPYQPICSYLDTIAGQVDFPDDYPGMKRFRIGSYAVLNIQKNPQVLQLIKEYIANGQAVAFSGPVLCGYCNLLSQNGQALLQDGVIYGTNYIVKADGKLSGHGQLIVGYDDNIGTPGNTGALLIQNSFGTDWPPASSGSAAPPGMIYWSYNSFTQTQLNAAVAYPRSPEPFDGVRLSGSRHAPKASISSAFQWAPDDSQAAYFIMTHFFHEPVFLQSIELKEPGAKAVTATASFGHYISNGYSYLTRTDGKAFRSGVWTVVLEGQDASGNPITYTGKVLVGTAHPNRPKGASMVGQIITGSTGAVAVLSY